MEGLIALLLLALLALPVVALVVAILAHQRATRLQREIESLQRSIDRLAEEVARGGARPAAAAPAAPVHRAAPEPVPPAITPQAAPRPEPAVTPQAAPRPEPTAQAARSTPPPTTPPRDPFATVIAETPAGPDLEERVGARLTVWIGAIALALAGTFLVKYSFERGLLGPSARVSLGLLFGVALLGLGEWMRVRSERVGQGLAGAGIAVLFASLFAATTLYHLIGAPLGFGLMAATTATAVALSLRQGPFIALLGLVGGFMTPVLVRSEHPSPYVLFVYLFLLQAGLVAVVRRRGWWLLGALTLAGGLGWAGIWMATGFEPAHVAVLGAFIVASSALFVFVGMAAAPGFVWGGAGAAILLVALLVARGDFGALEWGYLGLVGAGCLVLARLRDAYLPLAWIAAATTLLSAFGWSARGTAPASIALVCGLMGVLYVGFGYAALWGSPRAPQWASLAASCALGFFLVAWHAYSEHTPGVWGGAALALAALFVVGAFPVARRRTALADGDTVLGALAVAVTAFVALAIPLELERAWIAVAWAVMVPLLGGIDLRLRLPALQRLAWAVGALACARLIVAPFLPDQPLGESVILNWLTYGYGVPAAAFAAGAWIFRRCEARALAGALHVASIAGGTAMVTLLIRHGFHRTGLWSDSRLPLAEWGAYALWWCVAGIVLALLDERWPAWPSRWGSRALGALGVALAIFGGGVVLNPMEVESYVAGGPVVNTLLWCYGVPAATALWLALRERRRDAQPAALTFGLGSLILTFLLITLEVRQAFHGARLDVGETTSAELYAYSIAWMVFGMVLLVTGIKTTRVTLRQAGLLVMAIAVGKVFLWDTARLGDLWRVLSFLALGASLVSLGYLYQRFVKRGADR